jgi:hypothetical protein
MYTREKQRAKKELDRERRRKDTVRKNQPPPRRESLRGETQLAVAVVAERPVSWCSRPSSPLRSCVDLRSSGSGGHARATSFNSFLCTKEGVVARASTAADTTRTGWSAEAVVLPQYGSECNRPVV